MPGQSISQIPLQASNVNGATDFILISQATGNPSAPYQSKKALANLLAPLATGTTKGTFTLATGAASTVVNLIGCVPTSVCLAMPTTLHAANAVGSMYFTMGTNQFTVSHANNSLADRTFSFILFY